jgi:FtsH-binding integral membrane protein
MNNYATGQFDQAAIDAENGRFMAKVYRWMSFGILITGFVSFYIGSQPELVYTLMANKILFYGLIIGQFGLVIWLSARIQKMSAMLASGVFLVYSALTGVTFSTIFVIYTMGSIQSAFFTTAFSFAGLSLFGQLTKRDLGPVGTFCNMGLFGLIGFSLLSWFFPSMMGPMTSKIYSLVGVIVFAGLTAYDTQKIKEMNIIGNEGTEEDHKEAISGALTLYLDFINLFLMLLRLMGDRKD